MKYLRKNSGFTLMELIVAIAVGSMVTIAATSLLLLGLRLDSHSRHTITQQNTARIVTSMLEDIAAEGSVKKVISGPDGWYICSTDENPPSPTDRFGDGIKTSEVNSVLAAYEAETGALYVGGQVKITVTWQNGVKDAGEIGSDPVPKATEYTYEERGTPILQGVWASDAVLSEENLLTVSVRTKDGSYRTSTYCRLAPVKVNSDAIVDSFEKDEPIDESLENALQEQLTQQPDNGTEKARKEFLKVAASQINSQGIIKEKIGEGSRPEEYREAGRYYAQWYNEDWPEDTAWCACFVVWATDHTRWDVKAWGIESVEPQLLKTALEWGEGKYPLAHVRGLINYLDGPYREASGENAMLNGAEDEVSSPLPGWYPCEITDNGWFPKNYKLTPGDLIFFDYDGLDADHVGIVLTVVDGDIYTIEGNTADMVAVRKYRIDDPRIMGYGVLDWMTNGEMLKQSTVSGIETE